MLESIRSFCNDHRQAGDIWSKPKTTTNTLSRNGTECEKIILPCRPANTDYRSRKKPLAKTEELASIQRFCCCIYRARNNVSIQPQRHWNLHKAVGIHTTYNITINEHKYTSVQNYLRPSLPDHQQRLLDNFQFLEIELDSLASFRLNYGINKSFERQIRRFGWWMRHNRYDFRTLTIDRSE